ncbi:MAG: hypothetical protein VKN33_00975 [Candidatus Sericytochromatia bacterium]|nr:hypothetical protein [Candidatus Sericytochromatia bacterium]
MGVLGDKGFVPLFYGQPVSMMMSLPRWFTAFCSLSLVIQACQAQEELVFSQMPSMSFPAAAGGASPTPPQATLPPTVVVEDSTEDVATVDAPAESPQAELSPAATAPLVVDVPILPLEPSAEPFPDLPHEGDLLSVCRLFSSGPARVVQAALPGSEETPGTVSDDGQRYDVDLGDTGDGFEGSVVFENTRTAVYGFYLSADVPLEVFIDGSLPLALESSKESPAGCSGVAVYHFVEILPGQVTLNFGPHSSERISLVVERAQEATP